MSQPWRPPRRTVVIDFPDGDECHGLVVKLRSLKLGALLSLTSTAARLNGLDPARMNADDLREMGSIYDLITENLVAWNIAGDDGEILPTSQAGLEQIDLSIVMRIIGAWMQGMAGVPAPLAPRSNDGDTFEEASLPMDRR